ncbi:MAG: hypothetical protein ABIG61_02470 [Planctomycetota bacterium]
MNKEKWERHYKNLGIDPSRICSDGIFDDGEWKNANKKILFIMKEVNSSKGGWDLKTLFENGPKYQMWHTISRWAGGILNNFPKFEDIDKWSAKKANIKKIASINLKKTSGGPSSDMSIINAYAHMDKELLLEQIDEIKPEIIVACGTFDSVIWLLDLKKVKPDKPYECPVFEETRNIWVIPWIHPGRVNNKDTYNELKKLFSTIAG